MFDIQIDKATSMVAFVLSGPVQPEEMDRFVIEFRRACEVLQGKEFLVKADVRSFSPTVPEVVQKQSAAYQSAIDLGVERFAEIVESDVVAKELNRMAREGGTEQLLRRFFDADAAQDWLLHGD